MPPKCYKSNNFNVNMCQTYFVSFFYANNMFIVIATLLFVENNAYIHNKMIFHKVGYSNERENYFNDKVVNTGVVPDFFDWRLLNMVSPVKSQGTECNACWAFSANANIESQLMIQFNREEILSEQFLIDCTHRACNPATVIKTFADIVTEFGGVLRNDDYYIYTGEGHECRWNSNGSYPSPVPVIGFRRVLPDEDVMADYLYRYGPLSAGINAAAMMNYSYHDKIVDVPTVDECNPTELDHAILIVGYGVDVNAITGELLPYWVIKNSWGTGFGDHGYYYMVRGRNACGIASDVSFAIVN